MIPSYLCNEILTLVKCYLDVEISQGLFCTNLLIKFRNRVESCYNRVWFLTNTQSRHLILTGKDKILYMVSSVSSRYHDIVCHTGCGWSNADFLSIIISSDNGWSPGQHQAIIWTNVGILLIGPWTNFLIEIHIFSLKKMSSGKWRPFCVGLNVLKQTIIIGLCPRQCNSRHECFHREYSELSTGNFDILVQYGACFSLKTVFWDIEIPIMKMRQSWDCLILLCSSFILKWVSNQGGWFVTKVPSYQYRKPHCGDKTILWQSVPHLKIKSFPGTVYSRYIVVGGVQAMVPRYKWEHDIPGDRSWAKIGLHFLAHCER